MVHNSLPPTNWSIFKILEPGVTWVFYLLHTTFQEPNGEPAATWKLVFVGDFFTEGGIPWDENHHQITPIWVRISLVHFFQPHLHLGGGFKDYVFLPLQMILFDLHIFFNGVFQPPTSEPAESFRTLRNHTVQWCSPRILWRCKRSSGAVTRPDHCKVTQVSSFFNSQHISWWPEGPEHFCGCRSFRDPKSLWITNHTCAHFSFF